eukprot:TRINITY_DN8918_c0_g1_i3.p1 TRINITY_DN8918_c0_g1~~TRINITY_DN8918_c0_g1_i3.p1  ORF type:complete len:353 (+),score=40.72 TRINITY_DN8918_c0_g1_i3:126-1061(+)
MVVASAAQAQGALQFNMSVAPAGTGVGARRPALTLDLPPHGAVPTIVYQHESQASPPFLHAAGSAPPSPAESMYTPANIASTAWRTKLCPMAPQHHRPRPHAVSTSSSLSLPTPVNVWPSPCASASPLANGTPTSMGNRSPMMGFQVPPVITPQNATTNWRTKVCPGAPMPLRTRSADDAMQGMSPAGAGLIPTNFWPAGGTPTSDNWSPTNFGLPTGAMCRTMSIGSSANSPSVAGSATASMAPPPAFAGFGDAFMPGTPEEPSGPVTPSRQPRQRAALDSSGDPATCSPVTPAGKRQLVHPRRAKLGFS